MRASLWAAAVIAFGAPKRARIRRKKAPIAVFDRYKLAAANLKARATRLSLGLVLLLSTFPPEILFPGQRPNQEANAFALAHCDVSVPISERIFIAVFASIPGMVVRSDIVMLLIAFGASK